MTTTFRQLNHGWNAEPNAPGERLVYGGRNLMLSFEVNAFLHPQFAEGSVCTITFKNCWRYRLGSTNDEGWNLGKCRFSRLAPAWGEFNEIQGELLLDLAPNDWIVTGQTATPSHHYLFYLRDATFECDAESHSIQLPIQVHANEA